MSRVLKGPYPYVALTVPNGQGLKYARNTVRKPLYVASALPVLNQLSVQPVAAYSLRVVATGKTPITGTPSAITLVNDQVASNNLTPVAFSAVASDMANSLNYLLLNGTTNCLSTASSITLGASFELYGALGVTDTVTASAPVIGRNTFSAPNILQSTTQVSIRNGAGVATQTGNWALKGIHYFRYKITPTTTTVWVDGEVWATFAFDNSAGFGLIDRVGKKQNSDFFEGGIGEIIIFDQLLSDLDAGRLNDSGSAAWRTPFYIEGDTVANNNATGWSPERAWKNYDLINPLTTGTALRDGVQVLTKRGATVRGSPLMITSASQVGGPKGNFAGHYGPLSDGAVRMILTEAITGPWTFVSGTTYSTPCTIASIQRVHWLKSGYTPQAYFDAAESAVLAAGPNQLVDWSAMDNYRLALTVGTSSTLVLNSAWSNGTLLYVNIGQDPTGQNIEVVAQNGKVSSRGVQTALNNWTIRMWMFIEGAAEDALVFTGTNTVCGGESWTQPMVNIMAAGDGTGGKGGTRNFCDYVVNIHAGVGPALLGSNGDGASWHGSSSATLRYCRAYRCDKSGFDHEQGTVVYHIGCIAAGCNQNYQVLTQGGGTGFFSYTDCSGKFSATDQRAMFQFWSNTPSPAVFYGGDYQGSSLAQQNTFISMLAGCTEAVTGQATRTNFTTDVNNQSVSGGTVNVLP